MTYLLIKFVHIASVVVFLGNILTGLFWASHARGADGSEAAWAAFETLYRRWERWGLLAIATPAAAMLLMVLKPPLPAL